MQVYSRVADFVGVPWVSGGRDPAAGCDCWGLILAAARDCYGLELPDYTDYENASCVGQTGPLFERRADWQRVRPGTEREGDVVVLAIAGDPVHAGLVVGPGLMLHSLKGRNGCVERYRSPVWQYRVEGFYRWSPP